MNTIKRMISGSVGIITTFKNLNKGIRFQFLIKRQYNASRIGGINPGILHVKNMFNTFLLILKSSEKRNVSKVYFIIQAQN